MNGCDSHRQPSTQLRDPPQKYLSLFRGWACTGAQASNENQAIPLSIFILEKPLYNIPKTLYLRGHQNASVVENRECYGGWN